MDRRAFLVNSLCFLGASLIPSNLYPFSMSILQVQQLGRRQMMGYIILSPDKKVVVIDGGSVSSASFLVDFIENNGGRVSHWLITHPHDDHVGALTKILADKSIKIESVCGSLPTGRWVKKHGGRRVKDFTLLSESLNSSDVTFQKTVPGDIIEFGGMNIEVLSDFNPEITRNAVNNSSIVYRFYDCHKSALFLGDLGVEGGEKLLAGPFGKKLKSDYVQMAHHGQNGVGRSFYEEVKPIGCFWPTPMWLFENDSGAGVGSGRWKTLEVRRWMHEIGVKKHYIAANGLQKVI